MISISLQARLYDGRSQTDRRMKGSSSPTMHMVGEEEPFSATAAAQPGFRPITISVKDSI
jgi:hypothetical protein